MTGAVIPKDCDVVIMKEETDIFFGHIFKPHNMKKK